MQSTNYKLIKEARIKFKKYIQNEKANLTKLELFNFFQDFISLDVELSQLDFKTQLKLLNFFIKDYNAVPKKKLNNVLGRKLHLFHVVFPSI